MDGTSSFDVGEKERKAWINKSNPHPIRRVVKEDKRGCRVAKVDARQREWRLPSDVFWPNNIVVCIFGCSISGGGGGRDSCYFSWCKGRDAAGSIGSPTPPIVLQLRFNCNVCYKEWGHWFGAR